MGRKLRTVNAHAEMLASKLLHWGSKKKKMLMNKVQWSLNYTTVCLPTSLPSIKNERRVLYDTPEYNELRGKE